MREVVRVRVYGKSLYLLLSLAVNLKLLLKKIVLKEKSGSGAYVSHLH